MRKDSVLRKFVSVVILHAFCENIPNQGIILFGKYRTVYSVKRTHSEMLGTMQE